MVALDNGRQVRISVGSLAPRPAGGRPRPSAHLPQTARAASPVVDRLRNVNQVPDEYAWMLQGDCRGADTRAFFPSNGLGVEAAQRICRGCPVQNECLEYALLNRIEQGVWGGASERERRRILRQRRRAGALPS
jgi:WhiB family transcriptional regulator, redox-sensing transcriptional regulator